MTETNYLWIVYLAIGAGIIFIISTIEIELGKRREAHRKRALVAKMTKDEFANNSGTLSLNQAFKNVVRGYDSPQLFREDALIRLRALEQEIARELKKSI